MVDPGEYRDARRVSEDALARCRRVLGEDHPNTLKWARVLTLALYRSGEYQQARRLGEDALARCRRVLGTDHPDTLKSAHVLVRVLGDDDLWTLRPAHRRTQVMNMSGEYLLARWLGEDTWPRFRRVLGEDHPDTLQSAHVLTMVLYRLGEYHQAWWLGADTLARLRRIRGADHPDTLDSAHIFTLVLGKLGELQHARRLGEDTLARYRRVQGSARIDALRSAFCLTVYLNGLAGPQRAWQGSKALRWRTLAEPGDALPGLDWRATQARFDALRGEYAQFECDPLAVLRLPALVDVTVPSTARFVDAFAEAQALNTDTKPPPVHCGRFAHAVDQAWRAWHAAREAAQRIQLAGIPPGERATVQRVIKLLTLAHESGHDAERIAAYGMARAELAKLERSGALSLPPAAAAALIASARSQLPPGHTMS
ncbi:MAG TPA: tetratricopeptide repeat protein [Pseudonocardiaceae bacterium]|nr:tetratricopeptide repeat protein [Pseudonocardiaceae bacterium]